uniref:RIIa domain-containing protein n=1 Tax=Spongospora subterranea TaxID=70186 RepID=A0A0H5R9G8_9EUKA|eukprot:CRZ05064.1 hypothetical protein [Spongospora subterranea]
MVEESASRPDIDRYLETTGLDVYIQDALILVLENRPEDPIRFLVEYFQTCEKPGTPLSRAYRYLTMTPRTRPAFMYNLVSAFTILNTAKSQLTFREKSTLINNAMRVRWVSTLRIAW